MTESMADSDWLAQQFETNRGHLRAVAYRMLGSVSEADDAVQEAWLRIARAHAESIVNLSAWLTTVVAHVCLDMLRSRSARREESMDTQNARPVFLSAAPDPESEAQMADSVGLALLVVLDRLSPQERLAFVLHDIFAMPFEEIATILDRSPVAARQLASRARRRVQGGGMMNDSRLAQQRGMAADFLAALRSGDFEGLVTLLDPEVVVRADQASVPAGAPREIRGARIAAQQAIALSRGAKAARLALIDGVPGLVVAPGGKLVRAVTFSFAGNTITQIEVLGDPARLGELEIALLD
jgi:RNA polymerase sigma factor (sigma-70 family)